MAPGFQTGARRRSVPTARRVSPHSTGCRSTSTCCTRRIRARRGAHRCVRLPGSSTTASSAGIGLANVNRRQLDEALELVPVAAVQVALSPFDDRAVRGGLVERCAEQGIAVMAHSPLGGPGRAARVGRVEALVTRRGCPRRDARRGGARVAARYVAGCRPDPGRAPAGDGALRSSSRGARPRSQTLWPSSPARSDVRASSVHDSEQAPRS